MRCDHLRLSDIIKCLVKERGEQNYVISIGKRGVCKTGAALNAFIETEKAKEVSGCKNSRYSADFLDREKRPQ